MEKLKMNDIKNHKSKTVMIMAGGTGGHIFPALSTAEVLVKSGFNISWLGTEHGLETQLVEGLYPINYLSVRGVRKAGLMKKLTLPFSLTESVWKAMCIFKSKKVSLVIGFGGYASGPGGLAAKLLGIPLFIHEQNARAGMTNRMLSKLAKKVFCAFPGAFTGQKKAEVIGNPVRKEIKQLHSQTHDFSGIPLKILILGGSQGAKILNDAMPSLLQKLEGKVKIRLWHQTGERGFEETLKTYNNLEVKITDHKIMPFIENMCGAYQWADIIICRAGALTVSEVSCAGIPAFFVPYSYAVDDHQYHNAQFLVQSAGAVCEREKEFTVEKLANFIQSADQDRSQLETLSANAKKIAHLNATDPLVKAVRESIK